MSSLSNKNSERPVPAVQQLNKTRNELNTLMKSIQNSRQKPDNETSSSNGGNNSDNSALVSLGNTSFGFNFDSEESNSKEGQNDSNDDSDGNVQTRTEKGAAAAVAPVKKRISIGGVHHSIVTSSTSISSSNHSSSLGNNNSAEQVQAAAHAVASLESIAARSYPVKKEPFTEADNAQAQREALERKRIAARSDNKDADSGGYNTDDDEAPSTNHTGGTTTKPSTRKKMRRDDDDTKREERNQREKERSFRISKQITELRDLLSSGGVVVPKGTKSSVLTEAASYIRMLQQHQYRSEIDRHQLVQQLQLIGGGAQGPQAASAVRHFAAQNGVWTLGNFGGIPPKSAMTFTDPTVTPDAQVSSTDPLQQAKLDPSEYRFIFNSCGAGIAIASMGGAFIDCNQLFSQLSNYSKQEICGLTLFNLTARQDLQKAFDQISKLISPPMEVEPNENDTPKTIVLRGAMKHRDDLGMSVALVKGDDGIAKCFCVTLVTNPVSPFDTSRPVPASFDAIKPFSSITKEGETLHTTPAFTSG